MICQKCYSPDGGLVPVPWDRDRRRVMCGVCLEREEVALQEVRRGLAVMNQEMDGTRRELTWTEFNRHEEKMKLFIDRVGRR